MTRAEVRLNPVFADNAVLQRDAEVPVWGTARDGEQVTVEIQGQKVSATATGGKWLVRLKPLTAGGPFTLPVTGDNKISLTNILVGEVWLCSGQSNMEWALAKSDGGTNAIVSSPQVPSPAAGRYGWADLPKVNLFNQAGLPASTFRTDDWPL